MHLQINAEMIYDYIVKSVGFWKMSQMKTQNTEKEMWWGKTEDERQCVVRLSWHLSLAKAKEHTTCSQGLSGWTRRKSVGEALAQEQPLSICRNTLNIDMQERIRCWWRLLITWREMPGAHKLTGKACSPTSQGEQTHKSKADRQHKKTGLALGGGKEY